MTDRHPIYLIVGPPAVGKSTTSRALAAAFPKSAHIPVDDLREMVVSGKVLPSPEWPAALVEQLHLARANAAHMALAYQQAGFAVVMDDFFDPSYRTGYAALIGRPDFHRVALYPRKEEAYRRNRLRAGDADVSYIDMGIEHGYGFLDAALPELLQDGWIVVDTTALSVEETVREILGRWDG